MAATAMRSQEPIEAQLAAASAAAVNAQPPSRDHSSIATRAVGVPGESTVRFNRWTLHGITAYQKGQYAGFATAIALKLVAAGSAALVATTPLPSQAMVTK